MNEMHLDRHTLAEIIADRLLGRREKLQRQWRRDRIANLQIDGVLPESTAHALYEAFPKRMLARRGLGELRYVSERMDQCAAQLREAVYAFRDPRVVEAVATLTQVSGLVAESRVGTSGISRMDRGHFLNPHVDRAHDMGQVNQQVLSLLYYVTPDLRLVDGGHLELWHDGPEAEATTILSKFNRLVIMATHGTAWHSVSPVRSNRQRCCLWTYYYAPYSVQPQNDNHVPVFRGRPDQRLRDLVLRADSFARQSLYKSLHRLMLDHGVAVPRPVSKVHVDPTPGFPEGPAFEEAVHRGPSSDQDRPS
ncbi:MAG: 2OG-Fe(II) oxygenase [Polyangiales bacterium]